MKNLQNLEAGDLIKNGRIELEIRDVIIKDKGEKTCYLLSQEDKRCAGGIYTAYELEKMGYAPYLTPEDKTEKLVEEYHKKIAHWARGGNGSLPDILRDFAKDLLNNK